MPTSAGDAGGQLNAGSVISMPVIQQPQAGGTVPALAYAVRTLTADKPVQGTSVWGASTVGGGGAATGTPGGTPTPSTGQIFPTARA